jgi:hypothetical protein
MPDIAHLLGTGGELAGQYFLDSGYHPEGHSWSLNGKKYRQLSRKYHE